MDREIIEKLGGTYRVAAIFGIAPSSVALWKRSGIPRARRQALALMYPNIVPESWLPPGADRLSLQVEVV